MSPELKTAFQIGVLGGIAPAAISFAIVCFGRRWLARRDLGGGAVGNSDRYLAAAAFAAAFFVGYQILPNWANLTPTAHWQWLPYLALLAAFIGGLRLAPSLSSLERWWLLLLLAALIGWKVTPSWGPESLQLPAMLAPLGDSLSRVLSWSGQAPAAQKIGYAFLLAISFSFHTVALERLTVRIPDWQIAAALTASSAALGLLLAYVFSVTLGHVTIVSAGAAGGVAIGCLCVRRGGGIQGMIAAWSATAIGMGFEGFVHPGQPAAFLLVPLAPLALWTTIGPASKLTGWKAAAMRGFVVAAALAVAAVLVLWKEINGGGDGY